MQIILKPITKRRRVRYMPIFMSKLSKSILVIFFLFLISFLTKFLAFFFLFQSGFGSKSPKINLKSRCYECNDMIEPSEVIPKKVGINRKTKKIHSCSKCEGMI